MHTRVDTVFRVSLILKGLDALIEIIGGVFLFFISSNTIAHWGYVLAQHELANDPDDWLGHLIQHASSHVSAGSTRYGAIYLLIHGVIKIVAVAAVLKNYFWAYPLLLVVLAGFLVYQCLQLSHHISIGLLLLSVFDVFVAIMTAIEWRKQIELREAEAVAGDS